MSDTPTSETAAPDAVRDMVLKFYPAFNTGQVTDVDQFLTPDWDDIPAGKGQRPGADGYTDMINRLRGFMPDCSIELHDVIIDGDRAAVHSTIHGTPQGEILGLHVSGKKIAMMTVDIHRITDGRIATTWHVEDRMGMLSQFGRPHLSLHPTH
jgi:predicted ester cyclase